MSVVDPATGGLTASYGGSGRVGTAPLEVGGRTVWFNSDGALNQAEGPSPSALDGPISDAASAGEVAILGNMFGEVAAVSLTERIWLSTLPGPVIAHPVVDGTRVYVPFGAKQGQPGGVAALNTETGAVLWSTRIQFEVGAAPALGRFLVVPGKAGGLVALDTEHGGVRWRTPDASPFTVQPIVFGGTVLAGDAQGGLQLVDMDDGGSVWRIDLGSPITGEGTALGETLVFGTADGRLVGVAE
jgi:outer membrane protein assembly factor BamB